MRFINGYAQISYTLVLLLKGNKKFAWKEAAQQAFDKLRLVFTTSPFLALPNFN